MRGVRFPTGAELVSEMERAIGGNADGYPIAWGTLVRELVESNLAQWELEDVTRDPSASDEVVANAKRAIDRLNVRRHGLVEQIDAFIAARLEQSADAPLATESPGMVLDRLSVLVIRRVRTESAAARQTEYSERLPELEARIDALSSAFDSYVEELHAGTRRFLPYEHFKLYQFGAADD
jgi:septation ring formation regulator EzrA